MQASGLRSKAGDMQTLHLKTKGIDLHLPPQAAPFIEDGDTIFVTLVFFKATPDLPLENSSPIIGLGPKKLIQ